MKLPGPKQRRNIAAAVFFCIVIALCLVSPSSFSQGLVIASPVSNQTFRLPDTTGIHSAADAQSAIATAETAGKALSADGVKEKTIMLEAQTGLDKARALDAAYITALTNFGKNDVEPYKAEINKYTATGTKYTDLLTKHNKATLANNALPAKDRKPATVAALNKEKLEIDALVARLTKWKTTLDAAKAKLDVKNAALQKQDQQQQAANHLAAEKLNASKMKLRSLADQLTRCANYAGKCRALLITKYNYNSGQDAGYFGSAAYRASMAELTAAAKN